MKINHGREPGTRSELRTATFTGEVWGDPVLAETDGVLINNVFFAPGARTHWHTHHGGQILVVASGEGRARTRDGGGGKLTAGDVVWIPPGEEHWHGAAPGSSMLHLAISLGGHDWLDPVTDEEYEEGWT
jgi:quercetin dioxygenase-like cupin family protein